MITQTAQALAEQHLDQLEASLPQNIKVMIVLRDIYDPDKGLVVSNDAENFLPVVDPPRLFKQKVGRC